MAIPLTSERKRESAFRPLEVTLTILFRHGRWCNAEPLIIPNRTRNFGLLVRRPDSCENRVKPHVVTVEAFANIRVTLNHRSQ